MPRLTTCGDTAKCAAATRIGADLAINYREQDFVEAVMAQDKPTAAHAAIPKRIRVPFVHEMLAQPV